MVALSDVDVFIWYACMSMVQSDTHEVFHSLIEIVSFGEAPILRVE